MNTTKGHPSRASVRCDPETRFSRQPMHSSAESTRLAFVLGQLLMRP